MPIIDTTINKFIDEALLAENAEREAKHEPSGLLSASMLYQPLRFQVLKSIGAPRKPMDAYILGKFERGNKVEEGYVKRLGPNWIDENGVERRGMDVLMERQKRVEYRGVIGFVDAVVDSDKLQFHSGVMPHEIKSVTNMKLKRIAATEVDYHYKMQAALYAIAMGSQYYAIDVISSEDHRFTSYIFKAQELKGDIDKAISAYMEAMEKWKSDRILPKFEANPHVKWTADIKYAMFSEFWALESDSVIIKQLEALGII